MNGGYCMINCAGLDFSASEAQTINGIYKKIYSCMDRNKPLYFYNILSGEDGLCTPIGGCAYISGDTITVNTAVKSFTVTSADAVTVQA